MNKEILDVDALELTRTNMRNYSYGIAKGRSYPNVYDGLKESYRRAIYGMHLNNSHKIVKVAELAAYALPYHPHPSSISGVIISLGENGNKLKLLDTIGNFGDSSRGIISAAERYIGGQLSNLSESLLCDSVEYCHFVKGEIDHDEPEALPALLPLCFINGLTGIPSGLPVLNIPTLNIDDMIDYYISILSHKSLEYTPKKLPKPNFELDVISSYEDWNNILKTGKGSIKVAPIMEIDKKGVITIYSLPGNKNVESIQKIVEKEYLAEKIDIRDESTEKTCIVIEKVPKKQCDMQEIYNRLYTKLQASNNFNMAFYDNEKIYVPCGFDKVVKANLKFVIETHQNRILHQVEDLKLKLKVLEIIDNLKVSNYVKKLAEMSSEEAIEFLMNKYKVEKEIASKVLQKPISYFTKEHAQELIDLQNEITELENDKKDIYEFLIKKYKNIKKLISQQTKDKFLPTNFVNEKSEVIITEEKEPKKEVNKNVKKKENSKTKSTNKSKVKKEDTKSEDLLKNLKEEDLW